MRYVLEHDPHAELHLARTAKARRRWREQRLPGRGDGLGRRAVRADGIDAEQIVARLLAAV